jgi:ribosomal protein L20
VGKLVSAVQEDISEIQQNLDKAREHMGQLEGQTKGINGLSAFLRAQGLALDKMVSDLKDEAVAVEKKMLGNPVEITHHTDEAHAARVKAAKGAIA